MRTVHPRVFLVAETRLADDGQGLRDYLAAVGAPDWSTDAATDAETLVEVAGRLCYRSFAPGLNPNVTRVRRGNRAYVANLLAQRHGSVLEHVSASFVFHEVSRVFTHELLRHRAGVAVSQESLRYVRLTDLPLWLPPALAEDPEARARAAALAREAEALGAWLAERQGLDRADFARKKALTSALRRLYPQGTATTVLWTANLRTIRHVLALRTAPEAEEEMRLVFDQVGQLASRRWPAAFQDFTRTPDGAWVSPHAKA